jgi:hypothetical protein
MSKTFDLEESLFSRRRRLHTYIRNGQLDGRVLNELLPNGDPHLFERQLWDYKEKLPVLSTKAALNENMKRLHELEIAEVVKDVVSFYNSYGGYLVIGVTDQPRMVTGFNKHFNCDALNRMVKSATRQDIECTFALLDVQTSTGGKRVGLLHIPQRSEDQGPAQFVKDAPNGPTGKKAYTKDGIYFREGDECRRAQSSEDFTFLCSQGRRQFIAADPLVQPIPLDNNLKERDPGFIRFIGRDEYLQQMWQWLCDKYNPGKLLAGIGGVGKTTIAREFAEQIIKSPPLGFERVIWFSAKQRYYTAILGQYKPTTRVDFTDVTSLLKALLLELGILETEIDAEWTRTELLDEVIKALRIIPSFVVIDDVDSLDPEQQNEVFHTILQVMGQAITPQNVSSRVLFTARLNLGAAPGQLVRVKGLELGEFAEYVKMTATSMGMSWTLDDRSSQVKDFHHVTEGSPAFAASVLRLVSLGEPIKSAFKKWKGSDGEEVRKFAFNKELNNLNDSQIRTLYAICLLGDTSQLELQHVTQSNNTLIKDDIGELRKYHLLATGSETPKGGARLVVPGWIRLMTDEIRKKVRTPKPIEESCARARKDSPKVGGDIGKVIHRVLALWRDHLFEDALQEIRRGEKEYKDNPNLKCLLGRTYLKMKPPDARRADAAFRRAYELKCERPELLDLWIQAKKLLGDWIGIVDLTQLDAADSLSSENVYLRATAFNQLGNIARNSGDLSTSAKYYLKGGMEIFDAFQKNRAIGRVYDLMSMKAMLFENHVLTLEKLMNDPNDGLEVWLATLDAFRCHAGSTAVMDIGMKSLKSWWSAVEQRDTRNANSARTLKKQLDTMEGITIRLKRSNSPNTELIASLETCRNLLWKKWHRYSDLLGSLARAAN